MLGDRAAQPDDRHLLDPVATPKPRSGRRGTRAVRGIDVDILLRDAAGRAAARHELQLDAEIPRAPPHRRRGGVGWGGGLFLGEGGGDRPAGGEPAGVLRPAAILPAPATPRVTSGPPPGRFPPPPPSPATTVPAMGAGISTVALSVMT